MLTKKQLSEPRRKFLELMQRMNFCSIHDLQIEQGEPQFDPPPLIIQDLKMGGNNEPRVELHLKDYALKQAQIELFQQFDELYEGVIDEVQVRYGLPQVVRIKRTVL